jgi:hypothetical protein
MHNYKGQIRREQHELTPTKSSWEKGGEFGQAQRQKY